MKDKIQLTDEKFLNLFKNDDGYLWAERVNDAPAVTVLPILNKHGEEYVCFIREYRPVAKDYIYLLPSGLVDKGEEPIDAAVRELKEETGITARTINLVTEGYTSIGLTNEYSYLYMAQDCCEGIKNLQDREDITTELVKRSDIPAFLASHAGKLCLRSALFALCL